MVAIEQKYTGSRNGQPMYRSVIISDNIPSALPANGENVDGMTADAVFAPGSPLIVVNENAYYLAGEDGTFVLQGGDGGSSPSSGFKVTISLTDPIKPDAFSYVKIELSPTGDLQDEDNTGAGTISSPTGSITIDLNESSPYIIIYLEGLSTPSIDDSNISCTGNVSITECGGYYTIFKSTGDGTITLSGIEYDD